jgi:hypothetical protein
MSEDKPEGKEENEEIAPNADLLDSSSEAALLEFLKRTAKGALDPTSDAASQPSALSSFSELEALGDANPAFDLEAELALPKSGGDGHRYVMLGQLGRGGMGEVLPRLRPGFEAPCRLEVCAGRRQGEAAMALSQRGASSRPTRPSEHRHGLRDGGDQEEAPLLHDARGARSNASPGHLAHPRKRLCHPP